MTRVSLHFPSSPTAVREPQRFVLKRWLKGNAFVEFWKKWENGFVDFWVMNEIGRFTLGNERSNLFCKNLSCIFEGVENSTLAGKKGVGFFCCTCLVAVQLT